MAFTARVTTLTQDKIMPKVVDTVLNSNVLATRMLAQAKPWSGDQMKFPVQYQKGTGGSSFSGFDSFSTAASQRRVNLVFDAKFYEKPVSIALSEVDVNATEAKVLDLVAIEMAMAANEMADEIGTIFYSDGTGNTSKDFLGLKAIVDDGTDAATYGGLARSTYTTLKSTVTASGGTLTLAKMSTLYNDITSGSQKPSLGLCPEAVFSYYEQLLQPMIRINIDGYKRDVSARGRGRGLQGEAAFTGLDFKGFTIVADEKATAQTLFFVNEDYLEWRALPSKMNKAVPYSNKNIEGNDYSSVEGLGFSWSGWVRSSNSYTMVGHVILGGELLSANPKRHGKLTGITGV